MKSEVETEVDPQLRGRLEKFAALLIDQQRARIIVPPQQPAAGFWFGGGNLVADELGTLWLVGRYRNAGDSRTGLVAGQRGLELAIFRSDDLGESFTKVLSLSKQDLTVGDREVLSIEGTALRRVAGEFQLFVSSEKSGVGYPDGLASFLKPGTGVWSIDRICAQTIEGLGSAEIVPTLASSDPRFVHVKDPLLARHRGQGCLVFCTHPFCWTSSNSGYVLLDSKGAAVGEPRFDFFSRGFTWDVAMTRATSVLPLPQQGVELVFYDGGECVRDLDEHSLAVKRPRGYSCEELGGLAVTHGGDLDTVRRISIERPSFISPHGTGCSRYVDVLVTERGYYATWQQSQPDRSQPLVMNFVSRQIADSVLGG